MTDEEQVETTQSDSKVDEQGPGWLPAILAATALMGIAGFIFCAFSTWVLFQYRTDFAIRTLRGAYIGEIEQSYLDPESKASVVDEIEALAADLERGKYENAQAAAILQRLQRLPVIQWGELQAIEAYLESLDRDDASGQIQTLSRLRRAVELGRVTSFDVEDVLQPVRRDNPNNSTGTELALPLTEGKVMQVIQRAGLLVEREDIPKESFQVRIDAIVRREIKRGAEVGGF